MTDFVPFPKIPRLHREIVVTEKIDGTNACIKIEKIDTGNDQFVGSDRVIGHSSEESEVRVLYNNQLYRVKFGSRKRWIFPNALTDSKSADNFGFAAWAYENLMELMNLGEGIHHGEWWGSGIQRGYDQSVKRFSLFNVTRWDSDLPTCLSVVPTLYRGPMIDIKPILDELRNDGSYAAPGYMNPEGVIVYHTAANQMFKALLENDEGHKGQEEAA